MQQATIETKERMIRFIELHCGCEASHSRFEPGRLLVSSDATDANGNYCRDSQAIDATWSAVRNWLGY